MMRGPCANAAPLLESVFSSRRCFWLLRRQVAAARQLRANAEPTATRTRAAQWSSTAGHSWGGGWYDPGDDGSDYGDYGYDDGTGYYDDGSYDDGSGYYDDGSGDDGSGYYDDGSGYYDDGSGDDGSGDDGSGDYGSGDDGSGDDGSGDDGSGDDGTASKHHLRLQSGGTSHTQTRSARANSCYAYTCTVACAVGTRTGRVANGVSVLSTDDACVAAEHGLESWAHHALGADVTACKQVPAGTTLGGTTNDDGRTPASPSVNSSSGSAAAGTGGAHGIHRSPLGSR